jgi:hypothetical protein
MQFFERGITLQVYPGARILLRILHTTIARIE